MPTIAEIKQQHRAGDGSEFSASGRFAVASIATRQGKNGAFVTLELRDASGSLTARCFDESMFATLGESGAIECALRVSTFRNSISAIVNSCTATSLSQDEVLEMCGFDREAHARRVAAIEGYLNECDGTVYGDVLRAVFAGDAWERFTIAPAAVKMHHAEPGGLVRHVHEVIVAGLALLDSTGKPYDRAYFLAGALLHDIGKLDTYSVPPTIRYTAQGSMVEHQIYSTFRVGKACQELDVATGTEAKLIHIIEQAHGAFRHASWQDPVGAEAKALAAADFFSSRLGVTDRESETADMLDELFAADSRERAGSDIDSIDEPSDESLFDLRPVGN